MTGLREATLARELASLLLSVLAVHVVLLASFLLCPGDDAATAMYHQIMLLLYVPALPLWAGSMVQAYEVVVGPAEAAKFPGSTGSLFAGLVLALLVATHTWCARFSELPESVVEEGGRIDGSESGGRGRGGVCLP